MVVVVVVVVVVGSVVVDVNVACSCCFLGSNVGACLFMNLLS